MKINEERLYQLSTMSYDDLLDILAEIEYVQWCSWAKSIINSEIISIDRKNRWEKLFDRDWNEFDEVTKGKDRDFAQKVLDTIGIFEN